MSTSDRVTAIAVTAAAMSTSDQVTAIAVTAAAMSTSDRVTAIAVTADEISLQAAVLPAKLQKNTAITFILFSGDLNFYGDILRLLLEHSEGQSSTYGYVFSHYKDLADAYKIWKVPQKLKFAADHGDEFPFVFGYPYITEEMMAPYKGNS